MSVAPETAPPPVEDVTLVYRLKPSVWFETKGVIRLANGRNSRPGELRANVLQRRIFALAEARRRAGKPCFCIGLKPRKRGFSTAVAALHYAVLAGQSTSGVIVGNKLETSETVYRMMALFAREDGLAREHRWSSAVKVQAESSTWDHGSTLTQSTAHGRESIRGQTPQTVHGTEVAHWEQEDDVFLALMNAIPDDPSVCVFLESTPKGRGGAFHTRWEEARWPKANECPPGQEDYWQPWATKCPDQPDAIFAEWEFVRVFAAWFEFEDAAFYLDAEQRRHIEQTLDAKSWYQGERSLIEVYGNVNPKNGKTRLGLEVERDVWEQLAWRRMTIQAKCGSDPAKFDQEYPRDPHSCFLSSGRGVFDADALEHYTAEVLEPEYGTLDTNIAPEISDKTNERVTWRAAHKDDAIFYRWESPRFGCQYLIVLDTAEGDDQAGGRDPDRHSCLILRRAYMDRAGALHKARLVARIRPPCNVPMHVLGEWVHRLYLYFKALVIPEMNSSGLAYIMFARLRGTPVWKRTDFNPRSGKREEKLGWRTTDGVDYGGIRTVILDALGGVLRERGMDLNCGHVVNELGTFVDKSGRKEAESGKHDDDVLALAIGLYNIDAATAYTEDPIDRVLPADLRALVEGQDAHERRGRAHFS